MKTETKYTLAFTREELERIKIALSREQERLSAAATEHHSLNTHGMAVQTGTLRTRFAVLLDQIRLGIK